MFDVGSYSLACHSVTGKYDATFCDLFFFPSKLFVLFCIIDSIIITIWYVIIVSGKQIVMACLLKQVYIIIIRLLLLLCVVFFSPEFYFVFSCFFVGMG